MHKRTSSLLGRAAWLMPAAAMSLALVGCPDQELAPLNPCTVSAVVERVDQSGISDVDLLFMIDNSGSMASKQARLAVQLPRLLSVLTSGDRCTDLPTGTTCMYDDTTTPKRLFTPVKSLHLGVVTSNLGGIDDPPTQQAAIASCADNGDNGHLQNSTDIAVNGVMAVQNGEFGTSTKVGDTIIPADPSCANVNPALYQEYNVDDMNLDDVETAFKCVAKVGVRGCPFEQQLESPWKALAPSDGKGDNYKFLNNTVGQGDTFNDGFLRDDAILAVLLVTDEDDCAITDAGKVMFIPPGAPGYDDANAMYGALNLRCGFNYTNPTFIQPTDRYVSGFQALKPDNTDRVIFAAITGVPQDAITQQLSFDDILALPEMTFTENMAMMGYPNISCSNSTNTEVAYPPIRIVQVAQGFGDQGIIYSICEDDYAPALNLLIEKIASKLKGNCLPRKLTPDDSGKVNCQVFELLPDNMSSGCDANYGLSGNVVERQVTENGKLVKRKACAMTQVPLTSVNDGSTFGWYYDTMSPDLVMNCPAGQQQRISFQFKSGTDLPSGAGATFECFQPVARIDNDAKGFDAVNTSCGDANSKPTNCDDRQDKTSGYTLACISTTLTCQIQCQANPDCPPGWVCDFGGNMQDGKYCQLPTCPQDNKNSDDTSTMM